MKAKQKLEKEKSEWVDRAKRCLGKLSHIQASKEMGLGVGYRENVLGGRKGMSLEQAKKIVYMTEELIGYDGSD